MHLNDDDDVVVAHSPCVGGSHLKVCEYPTLLLPFRNLSAAPAPHDQTPHPELERYLPSKERGLPAKGMYLSIDHLSSQRHQPDD